MGMRHASRHHIWRGLAEIWPRYGRRRGLTRFGATCPARPAVVCRLLVLSPRWHLLDCAAFAVWRAGQAGAGRALTPLPPPHTSYPHGAPMLRMVSPHRCVQAPCGSRVSWSTSSLEVRERMIPAVLTCPHAGHVLIHTHPLVSGLRVDSHAREKRIIFRPV